MHGSPLSLSLVIQIRGVDMSSSSSTVYGASFLVSNKQVFDGSDPHRSRLVFHWLDVCTYELLALQAKLAAPFNGRPVYDFRPPHVELRREITRAPSGVGLRPRNDGGVENFGRCPAPVAPEEHSYAQSKLQAPPPASPAVPLNPNHTRGALDLLEGEIFSDPVFLC
jgi:hypothetical protein